MKWTNLALKRRERKESKGNLSGGVRMSSRNVSGYLYDAGKIGELDCGQEQKRYCFMSSEGASCTLQEPLLRTHDRFADLSNSMRVKFDEVHSRAAGAIQGTYFNCALYRQQSRTASRCL